MARRPQDRDVLIAFGARLRSVREATGITQVLLARRSRLTPTTISLYESGDLGPSLTSLRALAKVLGVEPAELLREQGALVEPRAHDALEAEMLTLMRGLRPEDREWVVGLARRLGGA